MPDFAVSAMTGKNIDAVLEIEAASFKRPWSRPSFMAELASKDSRGFVLKLENACKTDQIIAYLCFRFIVDDIHILKIAVAAAHRKKGYGLYLLHHCLRMAKKQNVKTAFLEVRQLNAAAIRLYQKAGFYIEAQHLNYYSDTQEDAVLMRKNILKEDYK
jgi:ribosomal-protein-alanine N-acetyltransferase